MPPSNAKGGGGLYERLVVTRPPGTSKFRSMRQDLALFEADDLYAYACPISAQNPRLASSEALIARAEQRVQDWMRNTSERSAAERLCSRARALPCGSAARRRRRPARSAGRARRREFPQNLLQAKRQLQSSCPENSELSTTPQPMIGLMNLSTMLPS